MAKVDFNLIGDDIFTTIDGRELKIKDYFRDGDFTADEDGAIFVRHVGLLRAAKKVFIIEKYSATVVQTPQDNNQLCATVKAHYTVQAKTGNSAITYQWSSVADCHRLNSMEGFDKYTTTIAETRASARALRSILGVEFCSKEEVAGDISATETSGIQAHQKALIESKFMGQMGVSLEEVSKVAGKQLKSIDELTKTEAAALIQKLNSGRSKKKDV